MPSIRENEELPAKWKSIYTYGFGGCGVLLSLITMLLILLWLLSSDGGSLGLRQSVVTTDYFNWHPLLMSMAFLLFMTPATSAFEVYSPCTRNVNKNIHAILQSAAVVCIIIGYIIIYDCHAILAPRPLALSMHSIAGYITIALVLLNYSMAFVLYVLKLGGSLRGELKPFHKRLGMVSLFMGYATILMGMTEKANSLTDGALVFAQVIVGLVIGTTLCVSFSILKFMDKKPMDSFKYHKIPDDTSADKTVQF